MRVIISAVLLLALSSVAHSQSFPDWEIYGGADYMNVNACPIAQELTGNPNTCSVPLPAQSVSFAQNLYGWHATIGENGLSWLGAVLDFSGDYANRTVNFGTKAVPDNIRFNAGAYPFLFGPRFYDRKFSRFAVFAEPLIGGVYIRANTAGGTTPFSETKWAFALGGGADIDLSPHLAVRVEGDWIRSHFAETLAQDYQNNYRISGGLVFKIGRK